MSLDVSLISDIPIKRPPSSGIFIRENGHIVEISEAEWYKRHPDREPVRAPKQDEYTTELYSANITHNLGQMASHAGLYDALWHPEDKGWQYARDIIPTLKQGLAALRQDPEHYRQYDADNGWGTYDHFVPFVIEYLEACRRYPDAKIKVDR